jgi:PAS domain S-box-containing protein
MTKLFDQSIIGAAENPIDFITNLLQASTEYSMIGISLEGKILLWNEGARRLYGYEPDEIVGKANSSMLHTEEDIVADKPKELMDAALRDGKWEGSIKRRRKNGEHFTARMVLTPRRDSKGKPIGFLLISNDISSEIQLSEQLKTTQFYTRSLIESNIDALMTTDSLGIITDVNQQMISLTGYTRKELINTPFKNYFTDSKRAEEGIKQVLTNNRVTNYELTALSKTGRMTVVSYNASTFRDVDGKLLGVFAAARDMTEHKKLEQQLRESQVYNRGLIEASVDGLITVDTVNNISDVNEKMCRMSGYKREELIGTPFADYFVDPERALKGVRETFDKGTVNDYVLTLTTGKGKKIQVSFNASIFKDPTGTVRGIFASARDITEQAGLQTQLLEERAYNRGLIEASVDGLITVDLQGLITDVNEAMCRLSGYSRKELMGSIFQNYFTDPAQADLGVRRTFAEGSVNNYELILLSKLRKQANVSFNASVFRTPSGNIQGIFASARDISEEVRIRTQLGEQQAYNRSLIEASADALFAISPAGIITDVNEEATHLTGYSRKHLLDTEFKNYFTDPEQAQRGVQKTLSERRVLGYELVLISRNGDHVLASLNAGVFTDIANKPMGILAAARDITVQKELEAKLRDSQFYTRSLIESNIDALMTTDPIGVITDVNHQMEILTGCARETLIGSPFKQYFIDQKRAEEGIREVLHEGRVTNYELTVRAKDGKETVVSYNGTTFNDQTGKLQGVFAAARDVMERKRFEKALQETNVELERADRAKDRFLASMSHELRTPLNAIIGYGELLEEDTREKGLKDYNNELKKIIYSGKHLLHLINDVLDVSKIEAGKIELNLEDASIDALILNIESMVRPLVEKNKNKFTILREISIDIMHTDMLRVQQALLNLLSNANKFTKQGTVTLDVKAVKKNEKPMIQFTVTDTGIGIPADKIEKLFLPFSQAEVNTTHKYGGTGLGLYITKQFCDLLGGDITVQSKKEKGSIFTMTLPQKSVKH